uniref:Regulatory protein zeste n=2 Tax=Phlebotomus papatasi TaxID=29031 RepID=A0A1B0D536_PHLPP
MVLVDFMKEHPKLLTGKYDLHFRHTDGQRLWEQAMKILHNVPGSRKTWDQWRKAWHDTRKQVRLKVEELNRLHKNKIPQSEALCHVDEAIRKLYNYQYTAEIVATTRPKKEVNSNKSNRESIEQLDEINLKGDPDEDMEEEDPISVPNDFEAFSAIDDIPEDSDEYLPSVRSIQEVHIDEQEDLDSEPETVTQRRTSKRQKEKDNPDVKASPFAQMAQELMESCRQQAKIQEEYYKNHLNLIKEQTNAIKSFLEESNRQREDLNKHMEIQIELTNTMGEILKMLKK